MSEKRRAVEPVFGELKERLRQLDRWLADLETDDNKNSLANRMTELNQSVSSIHTRHDQVQESLATLNRFEEELAKCQAELAPVRWPETGIHALIAELRVFGEQLKNLDELESSGDEKLEPARRGALQNKLDNRTAGRQLDDGFNILDAIRLDFEELRERQAHLEHSLAAVETDPGGASASIARTR